MLHSDILCNLCALNVPSCAVKLIHSYLTRRSMCVRYMGAQSSFKNCPGGGLQGGLLTGILFILQVNKAPVIYFHPQGRNNIYFKPRKILILHPPGRTKMFFKVKTMIALKCDTTQTHNMTKLKSLICDNSKTQNVTKLKKTQQQQIVTQQHFLSLRQTATTKKLEL